MCFRGKTTLGTTAQFGGASGDVFSAICVMQISRFTASKPSKFAFASDEKSIRQPTTSFVRCCLKIRVVFFPLLPSRLRTRSCYFLARKKVTKERPEGAEEVASLDFSPLWTPPASSISCGKERRRLSGLSALPLRCFSCGKYKIRTCLRKKRQRHRYTRIFPPFRCPLHFAAAVLRNRMVNTAS